MTKQTNKQKEAIITNYIQTIITNSIKTSKNDLHPKKKKKIKKERKLKKKENEILRN